jgi:tRNA (cytidine32/uridine32-2'-O)-methyltransferase
MSRFDDQSAPQRPRADDGTPLGRIRFVLVETSLTGNMGAVARAMKNMGLSRLSLVRPRRLPDAEALARASGADELLADAAVHDTLPDALAGCRLVIGSSARRRTVEWPEVDPRECAERLLAEAAVGDVALLLGRESSGLTNEELSACHLLAHIPTNPSFSSLNIAAAAQVFAYEIRCAWLAQSGADPAAAEQPQPEPATSEQMEGFYAHLQQTLIDIGYADPEQSSKLQRRLRRLFNRARPDRTELNILRGMLSAARGSKSPDRFRK